MTVLRGDAMKQVLTVREAALRLGVTMKYVRDLLYEQRLPRAHKCGRVWRIPAAELKQWGQERVWSASRTNRNKNRGTN